MSDIGGEGGPALPRPTPEVIREFNDRGMGRRRRRNARGKRKRNYGEKRPHHGVRAFGLSSTRGVAGCPGAYGNDTSSR